MIELDAIDCEPFPEKAAKAKAERRIRDGVVFDIETGPLPWPKIEAVLGDYDESKFDQSDLLGYGEFDASAIKTGNLKPENAIAKVDAARQEHADAKKNFPKLLAKAIAAEREAYREKCLKDAALCPTTARALAIGNFHCAEDRFEVVYNDRNEARMIQECWYTYQHAPRVIGFGILEFDLPFLFRRSLILGIAVPPDLYRIQGRVFWDAKFVDLHEVWRAGTRHYYSLDHVSRALGVGAKNGSGADFAAKWKADRAAAMLYLHNDIKLTLGVAERIL